MADANFYTWNTYRCAYEHYATEGSSNALPLLLIHPLGVGLSGWFWHRFCDEFRAQGNGNPIYNPDLLGCGQSDKPVAAYTPADWAAQLNHLIRHIIQRPVVVVAQGATFPIALKLIEQNRDEPWVHALVLAGPPGWKLITTETSAVSQKLLWNLLFSGPVGAAFFRYARREKFLKSFSRRQLFAEEATIDREWLDQLEAEAADPNSRYAVFSFLAGFWREDYSQIIETIPQPALVLFGEQASGIDRISRSANAQKRLDDYLHHMPNATGQLTPGRNVLPYEVPQEFVQVTGQWLQTLAS
jgi:pimeloyl-ACP methyl ester carboxylesterase